MRKLSRELHENIVQSVLIAKMHATALQNEVADAPDKTSWHALIDCLETAIADMRSLSHSLNDQFVKKIGLAKAVQDEIERLGQQCRMKGSLRITGDSFQLDPEDEVSLVRVLQEAMRNIYRHSRATSFQIVLNCERGNLSVLVADNGRGFDPAKASPEAGIGILNMQERIEIMGGQTQVKSAPGEGTRIFITMPVKANGGKDNQTGNR